MKDYRADIEGLRALAVIVVILYHFQVPGVSGGFVGVDVFFVISGFVITQLLQRSFARGNFRFADFYARRIRRLVPVFLLVSTVTFLLITPFYMDDDYYVFAKSWLASLAGMSNFYFTAELSQYFAPAAQTMPLLHTWSLAVEEQFYLLWPAVLFWLWHRHTRRQKPEQGQQGRTVSFLLCGTVWLLMLGLSVWMAHAQPVAAYYLLPARVFELMLGAGVALSATQLPVLQRGPAQLLSMTGFVLIVGTSLLIRSTDPFPGLNALWPTWGAALILYSGLHVPDTLVARLLSTRVMVFLGGLSYSLYLWHWPPVAMLNYQSIEVTWPIRVGLLAGVLPLAWLSYHYVENRFRYRPWGFRRSFCIFILLPLLPIWAIQSTIRIADDLSFRIPEHRRGLYEIISQSDATDLKDCFRADAYEFDETESCWFGAPVLEGTPDMVLIGDSHALALLGFVEEMLAGLDKSLLLITYPSTPFVLPEHAEQAFDGDQEQIDRTQALHDYLSRRPMTVIASAWWNSYLREPAYQDYFLEAIDWLLQQQHSVILLEDVPELPSAAYAHCLLRNMDDCSIDATQVTEQLQNFLRFQQQVRERFPQVIWVNPREVICNASRCQTVLNGIPLYRDESHLNHRGSQEIGREYLEQLSNPLFQ